MDGIVNLADYPIDQQDHTARQELVSNIRAQLRERGCCVVPSFLTDGALIRMRNEAEALHSSVAWSKLSHNPYFTKEDTSLPPDHPKRFFEERKSGFATSDLLPQDSDLQRLFDWPVMTKFIGDCLEIDPLYQWDDPLGRNPYAYMEEGHYFPWHFDGNEFTVSLLVQAGEQGGVFEYAPAIRSPEDENFEGVGEVLAGARDRVHELDLRPGDLQLFKGRYSLHRVTKVIGKKPRIIALPCYATRPGMMNRPEHSIQVYGKALPIHYEHDKLERPDSLTD